MLLAHRVLLWLCISLCTEDELAGLSDAFDEATHYALLYSPSSRPFPSQGKGLLITSQPPHFYYF
jgi:hypothetical protein